METQTSSYSDPIIKPPPRPPDRLVQNDRQTNLDLDLEINKDFEENSPYQEGVISDIYQRPDKSQLVDPPELTDIVDTNKIVQKYLPKTNRYRQDFKSYAEKSIERNSPSTYHKGNQSRTFE